MLRRLSIALLFAALPGAVEAQPTAPSPATAAEIWPFPAPDPKTWWDDKRPAPPEAADPLGGRRLNRGERLARIDNGVDPSTYRLWGVSPLQWQLLRGDEMLLEVWVRPANSVRQSLVRVTVRRDGKAFVQARAGLACCEPGIGRRIGFDAELPAGAADRFRALRDLPAWRTPHDVAVAEGGQAVDALCVEGSSYDLTLLTARGSQSLRRACDSAAIGQVADVLEAVLGAALGHDGRFDVLYPGGARFDAARAAYRDLIAAGGQLRPAPDARRPAPGAEPAPQIASPMP